MSGHPTFQDTRWSLVVTTRGRGAAAQMALRELLEAYWSPLVVHQRRAGRSADQALEDVQDFLAALLAAEEGGLGTLFGGADPAHGKFRAYLIGALRHHVANAARAARADKRGGGHEVWSLAGWAAGRDLERELQLGGREPSPDAAYARAFALEVQRCWARAACGRSTAPGTVASIASWR
ncbi:MAG: hypothetical protein R3F49_14095 [Planctomycetota bacterium]